MRRAASTTSCDVLPRGLSMIRAPSSDAGWGFLGMESVLYESRRGSGRGLPGLAQKLLDPLAVLLGVIEGEMDFRGAAKLDAFGQLVANVADGWREPPDRALLLG